MKKLILVLTVVMFTTAFLCADVYIKTKSHTDAFEMMGQKQPAKDVISEQWIGKNKFAMTSTGQNVVVDLDKKVIYMINHASKTYIEATLPLDMSKLIPEQMSQMLSMIKINATVKPNGQTKTVGKWSCSGYDVVMDVSGMMPFKINQKVWASTDVPFDWKAYGEKMFPSLMKAQSMQLPIGDNVLNELKKINGFQVASEITMSIMGANMRITTEVEEITDKAAPAGTYSVPTGYTKSEKFSMTDMQQR